MRVGFAGIAGIGGPCAHHLLAAGHEVTVVGRDAEARAGPRRGQLRRGRHPGVGGEEVFHDPSRFDIGRAPDPDVGFGHGTHFCLGVNLARLEIDVMFNATLDRWADIEVTGEATGTRTNRLSGPRSLPVVFTDVAVSSGH